MEELTWNEYWKIAEYLEKHFPETDLSNIKREEVLTLIRKIPDFKDNLNPNNTYIDSLIFSWMSLRDPEADTTT